MAYFVFDRPCTHCQLCQGSDLWTGLLVSLLISLLIHAGHSLGAGAAALIALKLKDRFPEVKCWAFCPPGGLLTPNMAHSMKPFCTSVVVNKDAIPRMSLKNLNRFMEGKMMALACSRLNAFQIFWGSYGKVNRRHFFDKEIFRPISEMPEEAREMLERYSAANIIVLILLLHTEFVV